MGGIIIMLIVIAIIGTVILGIIIIVVASILDKTAYSVKHSTFILLTVEDINILYCLN